MSEMKLIMENWRAFQLNEIAATDPVSYGLLKAILKLMTGIKQGLVGDALASSSGIFAVVGGGDAKEIIDAAMSFLNETEERKRYLLSEDLVILGALMMGIKALGALSAGVSLVKFGKKIFKKLKGDPTEKTDKLPFLDLFNLDPKYSEIVDDRIEEEFLEWWLSEIDGQPPGDYVETTDLDVNLNLVRFLDSKYGRQLTGHTAPGIAGSGTAGEFKAIKKTAQKKRAGMGIGKQI